MNTGRPRLPVVLAILSDEDAEIRIPGGPGTVIPCFNVPAVRELARKIARRVCRQLKVEG